MLKLVDVARLSNQELRDLVGPRFRLRASSSLHLAAVRELEIRTSGGLDFDKSFQRLEKAARERRSVSYREIADASGAPWAETYRQMEGHLARLTGYAIRRGWPAPSAVVVRENVAPGGDSPAPLDGLLEAAKALGYAAPAESPFLREQQEKLAKWAKTPKEEGGSP
jgi:hypothetical protein